MKKLNIKRLIITIIMFIIILLICLLGLFFYNLSAVSKEDEKIEYKIELGTSVYEVIENLESKGIIKSSFALKLYSKLLGQASIDAGVYTINKNMSAIDIYKTLSEKNSINADEIEVTLVDGKRIVDYAIVLEEKLGLSQDTFLNQIKDREYIKTLIDAYWFLTEDVLNENIYYPLEGYIYPDTYKFLKDSRAKDIIEKILENTKNKLDPYKNDFEKNELSTHEIITIASIVETEGTKKADKNAIAGVFMNRIEAGDTFGSDVTTYYGLMVDMGERGLTQIELDDCTNLYNTRCPENKTIPGPISNPNIDTIVASLNPEDNDYYYFVADKYRNTYFSKTYTEHYNTITRLENEGLLYNHE